MFHRKVKVQVEPGQILVGSVDVVARGCGFIVLEADLHSKYVDIGWYGGSADAGPVIGLLMGEHTLKADPGTDQTTQVILPRQFRGWEVEAAAARYTVRIVAWKPRNRRSLAWFETDAQYEHARKVMDAEAIAHGALPLSHFLNREGESNDTQDEVQ